MLDELHFQYSQRFNGMKFARLAFLGYFTGTVLFYLVYKLTVYEEKWAANYGSDVPYYTKF